MSSPGSQSNSGLTCYFLVRHKRAALIPLSRYACELLLMKLVRFGVATLGGTCGQEVNLLPGSFLKGGGGADTERCRYLSKLS